LGRAKNKVNRTKHGVWFEEAQSVFSDPHARVFVDPEHSEEEERFLLLGLSSGGRLLVVVHLLQRIRFRGSDHFCAEGSQEGGSIL
jgi:uncharacterized DUF497 family protein